MLTEPKIVSLVPPGQTENNPVAVRLTEKYIKKLFDAKVLPKLAYIYFALVIEKLYNTQNINVEEFCDRWNITTFDFIKCVNDLNKKDVVHTHNQPKHIQLTLFPDFTEEDPGF